MVTNKWKGKPTEHGNSVISHKKAKEEFEDNLVLKTLKWEALRFSRKGWQKNCGSSSDPGTTSTLARHSIREFCLIEGRHHKPFPLVTCFLPPPPSPTPPPNFLLQLLRLSFSILSTIYPKKLCFSIALPCSDYLTWASLWF